MNGLNKGFTLIELLIVTVVIVTLMGVVFRLAGLGGDSKAKAMTISRLQRIENALSGYYAAYGAYPPVRMHGTRDIYAEVNDYGIQNPDTTSGGEKVKFANANSHLYRQIEAACRSQPFGVQFPVNAQDDRIAKTVEYLSAMYAETSSGDPRLGGGFDYLEKNENRWSSGIMETSSDWREIQLFKFGVMSYLLPRYLFMLDGFEGYYDFKSGGPPRTLGQWGANNHIPCRLTDGERYRSWNELRSMTGAGSSSGRGESGAWMVTNLASQAVCARWMPNFRKMAFCFLCSPVFYGTELASDTSENQAGSRVDCTGKSMLPVYSPVFEGGSQSYVLGEITVLDGWAQEFYYYSDPPYQSYRLWSSGANKKTFPPWWDTNDISNDADRQAVQSWIADDVVHMSN